jgi:MFS family permease
MVAAASLPGNIFATLLMDRIGRKAMIVGSLVSYSTNIALNCKVLIYKCIQVLACGCALAFAFAESEAAAVAAACALNAVSVSFSIYQL